MNGVGRSRREFRNPSRVRTHAQSRAEKKIDSLARAIHNAARCDLPQMTLLCRAASIQHRSRYRSAFGHRRPRTAALRPYLVDEAPDAKDPFPGEALPSHNQRQATVGDH